MLKGSSSAPEELLNHRLFLMDAQSSVKTEVLLDVRKDSFKRIGGVGNIQSRMMKVGEQVGKIPFDAVVSTASSAMRVMPSSRDLIHGLLFEECSPFVVPEFQPEDELCFPDMWKMPQKRLQILSRFELWSPRHVARDDGCLVEMAHLHGDGKALQYATSSITDDGSDLPSVLLQPLDAVLVRGDGFIGKEP